MKAMFRKERKTVDLVKENVHTVWMKVGGRIIKRHKRKHNVKKGE